MTARLRRLLASTFSVPEQDVPDSVAAGDLASWDSSGHLELLMAVELEYGVRIPTEQMADLASAESIGSFLRAHGVRESA
jgi:acyl carrier protein